MGSWKGTQNPRLSTKCEINLHEEKGLDSRNTCEARIDHSAWKLNSDTQSRTILHLRRSPRRERNGMKRDYVPDPLGLTVALLDNTQIPIRGPRGPFVRTATR